MRRTRINPISKRKLHQIEQEKPIRALPAERCGGTWIETRSIVGGYCSGGTCEEEGCYFQGAEEYYPLFNLHPHEKLRRGQGGRLTLFNSIMLCNKCHLRAGGIHVIDKDFNVVCQ